jgi:plasminogen activator inhibitor 1 RNA-binding protein
LNDWNAPESAPADDPWGAPPADDIWAASTAPVDDVTTPAPIAEEGEKRRERDVEEEDHTLTLEQYRAKKAEQEDTTVPKLEATRAANEGADASIWKDVVELKKGDNESAYFVGKVRAPIPPRPR